MKNTEDANAGSLKRAGSAALDAIDHISQATAQMWQAEAALRELGEPAILAIHQISQLRYALHKCKGLVPLNNVLCDTNRQIEYDDRRNQVDDKA